MTVRAPIIAGGSDAAETFRLAVNGLWVPASQLNVRTGVTSTPVLTGTGSFTCTVGPFNCVIDGTSNSLQGAYPVALDAADTVTINAASSQDRIDLIGLQIQDDAYDGSGLHQGVIVYVAGTPGSGTAPATPANTIALFNIPVAALASSVNFANATDVFPYTAAAGGIVPVRSSADKPATPSAVQYRHRLDITPVAGARSPLEASVDGVTYVPVCDPDAAFGAWTNLTVQTGFLIGVQPQYRTAPGGKIELRGQISNNATASSGTVLTGLPAPATAHNLALPNSAQNAYLFINGTSASMEGASTFPANTLISFDGLWYLL